MMMLINMMYSTQKSSKLTKIWRNSNGPRKLLKIRKNGTLKKSSNMRNGRKKFSLKMNSKSKSMSLKIIKTAITIISRKKDLILLWKVIPYKSTAKESKRPRKSIRRSKSSTNLKKKNSKISNTSVRSLSMMSYRKSTTSKATSKPLSNRHKSVLKMKKMKT